MTNKPVFGGFQSAKQNWSPLPHDLIGALPTIKSLAELKVVLYILRHTWGYQEFDEGKRISLDEFMRGRKRRDGSRIDSGVGMYREAVVDGIERAAIDGFILVEKAGDPGRQKHYYMLHMADDQSENRTTPSSIIEPPPVRLSNHPSSIIEPRTEKETKEENIKDTSLGESATAILTAIAGVTGCDPLLNPKEITDLALHLNAAGYSAPDVLDWHQRCWLTSWRKGSPPSLKEVRQFIGQVRAVEAGVPDGDKDPYFAAMKRAGLDPDSPDVSWDTSPRREPYPINGRWAMPWHATLGQLSIQLNQATYDTWLKHLVLYDVVEREDVGVVEYRAEVPHHYVKDWLERHLLFSFERTMTDIANFGEGQGHRHFVSGHVPTGVKVTISVAGPDGVEGEITSEDVSA